MNSKVRDNYFILLVLKTGHLKNIFARMEQTLDLLPGELLRGPANEGDMLQLRNLNDENPVMVPCTKDTVHRLRVAEFKLLVSIASCKERLSVFQDKEWLKEGIELKEGDSVTVTIRNHQVDGKIKYKGSLSDQLGIIFGIELNHSSGSGNGEYLGKRYFTTRQPDRATFVSLSKIRKYNLPIQIGDRVIWHSDEGPEGATVRWIGKLDDFKGPAVGVEFDNPCGTGTGRYKKEVLFRTEPGHASLIPMEGLMREDVFYGRSESEVPTAATESESIQNDDLYSNVSDQSSTYNNAKYMLLNNVPERYPKENYVSISGGPNKMQDHEQQKLLASSTAPFQQQQHEKFMLYSSSDREIRELDLTLEVGSMVEVSLRDKLVYGVIRWMHNHERLGWIVGLEMEEEIVSGTDGTFEDKREFECPPRKGFFIHLHKCKRDRRFDEGEKRSALGFGDLKTPDISEVVQPPQEFDSELLCGKNKGIQGHHNSCYLDVVLFSMFYFTTVMDNIFFRQKTKGDVDDYEEVQKTLAQGIVYPLRKYNYVRADKVMKLRALLAKIGSMPGMMNEEKDPEELINCLFGTVMKADPLLQLSSLQQSYSYQLFIERDEQLVLPTIQQLFELSFLQSNIKLSKMPSCLILQMPRFGKDFKMYNRIIPSLQLDLTDVLEKGPRECVICGKLATHECKECYKVHGEGLNTIAFCETCDGLNHSQKRTEHKRTEIVRHKHFASYMDRNKESIIPREKMELFAIICIETSHYVSFVKCNGKGESKWVFYDSMADRKGSDDGYNIPEVRLCPDLPKWILQSQVDILNKDDKDLPELQRRLFSDSYMCLYQDPKTMMFQ